MTIKEVNTFFKRASVSFEALGKSMGMLKKGISRKDRIKLLKN